MAVKRKEEEEEEVKRKNRRGKRKKRRNRKKKEWGGEKKEQEKEEEERIVVIYYENIRKPRKLHPVALVTILMTSANSCTLTKMLKSPESKWKTVSFPKSCKTGLSQIRLWYKGLSF